MQHYIDKLKIEVRALVAATNSENQAKEDLHKQNCQDYQRMIDMNMPKLWERNRVN